MYVELEIAYQCLILKYERTIKHNQNVNKSHKMRDNEMKNEKTNKRKQTIERLLFPEKTPIISLDIMYKNMI